LKRPVLSLLLAAAILLAGPFAVQETGWLHLRGVAKGMGNQPGSPPGQVANRTGTLRPARNATAATVLQKSNEEDETTGDPEKKEFVQTTRPATKKNSSLSVAKTGEKPWRARPEAVRQTEGQQNADAGRTRQTDSRERRRNTEETKDTPSASPAGSGGRAPVQKAPIRLFDTVAFRGNFNALPKWKRVLAKADKQVRALNTCTAGQKGCPPGAASWQRIIRQARDLPVFEKLKTVNAFFNKWPYRLDQDAYGTSDWWATPQEFLKLSGDCEDFAITKYYALRELGFSAEDMRIVVLQDRIRGIAHAILVVFVDTEAYVLDNVSSVVFSHKKYRHYVPYYSLNEKYRWSHIPLDKKP